MSRLNISKRSLYTYINSGRIQGDWALNKISVKSIDSYLANKKQRGRKTEAIVLSEKDNSLYYTIEETQSLLGFERATILTYLRRGALRGDRKLNKVLKVDVDNRLKKKIDKTNKTDSQIKEVKSEKEDVGIKSVKRKKEDSLLKDMIKAFNKLSKKKRKYFYHRIMAESYKGR